MNTENQVLLSLNVEELEALADSKLAPSSQRRLETCWLEIQSVRWVRKRPES